MDLQDLPGLVFVVVAVPAFLWAFASILSTAGTRHSCRSMSDGMVWTHETARSHLRTVMFCFLGLAVAGAGYSLLASGG